MAVFSDVLSAPIEDDVETTREDILMMSRLFREYRVAKLRAKDLSEFRKAA